MEPRPRLPVRWWVFGVLVSGVLVATLWLRFTATPPAPAPAPPAHSVAIVPFLNDSPDSAWDYLSDGLGDELATALGRVPGLRVAASGSTLPADAARPIAAGRRLGVGAVLLGSVRPASDRLRITARLMSVQGGFDVWSETYERPAADLIAIENEIIEAVVGALRLRAAADTLHRDWVQLTAPLAYVAYLQGRFWLTVPTQDRDSIAASHFGESLRLDSSYAPAWDGLAQSYVHQYLLETSAPRDVAPLALDAAERAAVLDSTLASALVSRAVIRLLYDRRPDRAGDDLARAIAIDPNRADGFHWQSHRCLAEGWLDSALTAGRRAIESRPADASIRAHLGWLFLMAREDSLADDAFSEAIALDGAIARTDEHFLWRAGAATLPLASYDSLLASSKERYVSSYALAVAAAAAGRTTAAVSALTRALDERSPAALYAGIDPRLDTLRSNLRFQALLTRGAVTTIPTRSPSPVP